MTKAQRPGDEGATITLMEGRRMETTVMKSYEDEGWRRRVGGWVAGWWWEGRGGAWVTGLVGLSERRWMDGWIERLKEVKWSLVNWDGLR